MARGPGGPGRAGGPGRGGRGASNGGGGRRQSVTTKLLDPVERAKLRLEKAKANLAAVSRGQSGGSTGRGGLTPGPRGQRGGSTGGGGGGSTPASRSAPSTKGTHPKKDKKKKNGGHASAPASSRGSGYGSSGNRGGRGGNGGGAGGSGGGSGGCFVEGTAIQMADGTTKEITTIQIGEETKGGTVQAKMEFMPQNIYEYKGVLVSGSHWVVEDNQFIEVQDSKHGVLTDRVEPVYTFKTSENRIWIHGIEFGDFETGSDEDWAPYFEEVKQKLNKELLVNSENI